MIELNRAAVYAGMKRFIDWHLQLVRAVRQEPMLLILFVALPFIFVTLLILNQRISTQALMLSELRADYARYRAEERHLVVIGAESITERITNLERSMYVDVPAELEKKRRPITSAEAWQRQRDAELRNRLLALEQWRAKQ